MVLLKKTRKRVARLRNICGFRGRFLFGTRHVAHRLSLCFVKVLIRTVCVGSVFRIRLTKRTELHVPIWCGHGDDGIFANELAIGMPKTLTECLLRTICSRWGGHDGTEKTCVSKKIRVL